MMIDQSKSDQKSTVQNRKDKPVCIDKNSVVSLRYRILSGKGGELENNFPFEPMEIIYGNGSLMPQLESELLGLKKGDQKTFQFVDEFLPADKFECEVWIDDIRGATAKELQYGLGAKDEASCGPDGCC